MEEKHRFILRHHWSNIRENLEPKNILPKLVTVLNETDEKEIKAQSTIQERCDKLLEILPRSGPDAFAAFVNALDKGAPHLALDLRKAEREYKAEDLDRTRAQSAKIQREISDLNARLEAEKQNIETLEGVKSDIATRLSNTRDLTEIKLERDELKKQCESLAKHLEEAQLVVSNLTKKLTATFQDRATSTRDLEEFDRTEGTTEHDLCDAREHSEKLRGEIRQLKTELEAEKQDHIKTSQELKELKSHHEIPKTEKSEQIKKLDDRIQQLTDERDSAERENQALKKVIQEWKTKSEKYEQENQALQKSLESPIEKQEKLEVLSSDLERANKEQQEQIRQLQRMNEELQDKVTNERELKTPAETAQQHTDERDSAEGENQTWERDVQEWKTKSEKYEQENQALRKSLESAMENRGKLELLSSDLKTANEEQQEQIGQLQRMNEELQEKVTNERELKTPAETVQQHTVERDSALKENQTLQKTIQLLKKKNMNCLRGYQALQKRYNNLKMSKKPEAVKKTQQETVKLGYKVTKQKTEFEEKLSSKKRKEMTTAAAKKKELESETKAKTSLQAQVVKLENKLKDCQIQMSEQEERFRKETNTERLKSNRLEGEVSRLKSRLMETIRPGRVHNYEKDFDTNGVVYALAKHFGDPNSIQTRIIATRSSNQVGEASDILENRVEREIVSGTMAEKESWWCVDLTENYALYLTHYTLRHGHNTSFSYLLNWQLQGSHDGQTWETLRTHDNDRGLKGKDSCCTCTWAIGGKKPSEIVGDRWKKAFRFFRIFQTGKHSSGRFGIFLSGIELYGVLVKIGR